MVVQNSTHNQRTRDEIGSEPSTQPIYKSKSESVGIELGPIKRSYTSIAGTTLIWKHPTFGEWGAYDWGGSSTSGFILGSSDAGILGSSKLGSNASDPVLIEVYNVNNNFIERFNYDTFINTSDTTADISTAGQVDFTDGEELFSDVIAYDGTTSFSLVQITPTESGSTSVVYSIGSNDDPSSTAITYQEVSANTVTTLSTPGKALYYKASVSGGTATINDIRVNYS